MDHDANQVEMVGFDEEVDELGETGYSVVKRRIVDI